MFHYVLAAINVALHLELFKDDGILWLKQIKICKIETNSDCFP